MIAYPRNMPVGGVVSQAFEPQRIDFGSPSVSGRFTSVTAGPPLWSMTITLRDGDEDEVAEWRAFMASLRGAQRTFLAGDLTRPYPKAYIDGFDGLVRATGGVFNGAATSWSINADRDVPTFSGMPAGFEVSTGDYVMWRWATGGVQRRSLGRAIERSTASGGGVVSVAIEPPLPALTPGGAVADFAKPECVMRMLTDKSQMGELDVLHSAAGTLAALQDLRA